MSVAVQSILNTTSGNDRYVINVESDYRINDIVGSIMDNFLSRIMPLGLSDEERTIRMCAEIINEIVTFEKLLDTMNHRHTSQFVSDSSQFVYDSPQKQIQILSSLDRLLQSPTDRKRAFSDHHNLKYVNDKLLSMTDQELKYLEHFLAKGGAANELSDKVPEELTLFFQSN